MGEVEVRMAGGLGSFPAELTFREAMAAERAPEREADPNVVALFVMDWAEAEEGVEFREGVGNGVMMSGRWSYRRRRRLPRCSRLR